LANARSLLHLAPEYCLKRRLSRLEGLHYATADLESPLAQDRVDLTRLPYPDADFDALICSHVLDQVNDDRLGMREMRRVLRPGGWAMVLTARDADGSVTREDPSLTDRAERLRLFGQGERVRLYGDDFESRLVEAGFEVRVERLGAEVPMEKAQRQRLGLHEAEEIFVCTNPQSGEGKPTSLALA
jgi:SAM-dependent methyltransferase